MTKKKDNSINIPDRLTIADSGRKRTVEDVIQEIYKELRSATNIGLTNIDVCLAEILLKLYGEANKLSWLQSLASDIRDDVSGDPLVFTLL